MRIIRHAIVFSTIAIAFSLIVVAVSFAASRRANEVNAGTISIISGDINGTYLRIAADLATVLDNGEEFRVLPIVGKGAVQNISDILYLRGVDIGIVQSDVMAHLVATRTHGDLANRVHYITKLFNEELHLIAGPKINSIADLEGKKVNLGIVESGTNLTARLVFKALGITVLGVELDQDLAIEQLTDGEIAATVFVAGKPATLVSGLRAEDNLHLVSIPFAEGLLDTYLPASFSAADYPNLIQESDTVDTLAIGAVMAVFNWPQDHVRYERLERFIEEFFSHFDELVTGPRHPKWREVNLAANLPGWNRFEPAAKWLAAHSLRQADPALEAEFTGFLTQVQAGDSTLTAGRREELFRAFLIWRAQQSQ